MMKPQFSGAQRHAPNNIRAPSTNSAFASSLRGTRSPIIATSVVMRRSFHRFVIATHESDEAISRLNPKHEARNPGQCQSTKYQRSKPLSFRPLVFGFVQSLEIMIQCLTSGIATSSPSEGLAMTPPFVICHSFVIRASSFGLCLTFGFCDLEFVWYLDFGIWNLFLIWCLGFRISLWRAAVLNRYD
jgi:hypothetical protein